ncbi:MAG TPA: SDR family oxidoreductase [Candidatus Saccharimonadia bacterium]
MKQTIVITGGSEGIGKAIAARLKHSGTVVIVSRDIEKGEAAARELGCQFRPVDVADYAAVEQVMKDIADEHGPVTTIINNAGLWIEGPLDANDPARMQQVILVNTLGVLNCTRAVLPGMKAAGQGTVINISSSAGLVAKPNMSTYDASKWGVTGLSKALQLELAPLGIRVSCVYPGKVNTPLFDNAGNHKDMADALEPDHVAQAVEFIFNLPSQVDVPDLSIRHL